MTEETRYIFERVPAYVRAAATARAFSARDRKGRLVAFDVADFSADEYAFYPFNFRTRAGYVPGTSDLLLRDLALAARAESKHYLNLGLGISEGRRCSSASGGRLRSSTTRTAVTAPAARGCSTRCFAVGDLARGSALHPPPGVRPGTCRRDDEPDLGRRAVPHQRVSVLCARPVGDRGRISARRRVRATRARAALRRARRAFPARAAVVHAPQIPDALDASATDRESDHFYTLSLDAVGAEAALPRAPRRAARELTVERTRTLGPAHSALIAEFLEQEKPPPRVSALFRSMADYVPRSDSAVVLTAQDRAGAPAAFYVVELEAASFATYVVGCRSRERPVPGASDLLFLEMLELARRRGKRFVHLGLGVNDGIRAFKANWGGTPSISYEFRALRCRAPAMLASLVARLQR